MALLRILRPIARRSFTSIASVHLGTAPANNFSESEQIAKAAKRLIDTETTSKKVAESLSNLADSYLRSPLQHPNPICTLLQSLARCDQRHVSSRIPLLLAQRFAQQAANADPDQIAYTIWSLSKLRITDRDTINASVEAALPLLAQFQPSHLAMLLHSLAKLKAAKVTDFAGAAAVFVADRIEDFSPRSLANILWAYATSRWPQHGLFKIASRAIPQMSPTSLNAHDIANLAWALAKNRCKDRDALRRLSSITLQRKAKGFTKQASSNLIWAHATSGFAAPRLAALLSDQILNSEVLAVDIWSLAKLDALPFDRFRRVRDQIFGRVREFSTIDLCRLAWAYASARLNDPEFFSAVVDTALQRADHMNPNDVSMLMWAICRTGCATSYLPILASLSSRLGVDRLQDRHLAAVVWSLSRTGEKCDVLFDAIEARILDESRPVSPQPLSLLLWSLACIGRVVSFPVDRLRLAGASLNVANRCQLHQWRLASDLLLDNESRVFFDECSNAMRDTSSTLRLSPMQAHISRYLPNSFSSNVTCPETMLRVNFARESDHVAVECLSRDDYVEEKIVDGAIRFKIRLLQRYGWQVVVIDHQDWHQLRSRNDRITFIERILSSQVDNE